jgi:hypothetical protein
MTNSAKKTYLIGVIERAIAYYMVDAADARSAAEDWQDGVFHHRDDDDQYVLSGYHLVNRIGYLISTVQVPKGVSIEVHIPMQTDENAGDEESQHDQAAFRGRERLHFDCPCAEVMREGAMRRLRGIRALYRFNHTGAKTMDVIIDNDLNETKTEVFVNAKSKGTVILAFVFAYGRWHIYQQGADGTSKNWLVTLGHKFRTADEGREFLRSKGWCKVDP